MAEIVNLRRAKKQRARASEESKAAENRIRFGTAKSQKDLETARRGQSERRLDGHRRENGGDADA